MKKPRQFTAFALSAVVLCLSAASASAETLPPAIQAAVGNGLTFEKSFKAADGLTGWILSQGPGSNIVLYTPADGNVAIAGNMFDAKGTNLNKQYLADHAPKPNYEKTWASLETSAWVPEGATTGAAKSIIYAFADANCSYCDLAWKALQPYTKVGLQIRWVPVAFLSPDSLPKAAALLMATDTSKAVAQMHAEFGRRSSHTAPVPDAIKAKIDANAALMRQYGFSGTPAIFYKGADGKVAAVNGMPSLSELPKITGLPAQPNNDPALARFR